MYLYGASGHAKVIIDILRANNIEVTGLVDDNLALSELCGLPICHDAKNLSPIIVSVGNCQIRKRIVDNICRTNDIKTVFPIAIHPSAIVSQSASIGEGTVVMQGAILQADVKVGRHCIINTKASVDHECTIEDFVHIAPGCTLSGNVMVGEGSWIGVGSTIIQGIKIGKNCIIGAGSVVTKDIPDGCKAYGVPCKVVG
ncbi:MAG: acetyltransferase [Bacteroidales bacterium]|nr:acetyltransferase [Bacteroidales bacterium]